MDRVTRNNPFYTPYIRHDELEGEVVEQLGNHPDLIQSLVDNPDLATQIAGTTVVQDAAALAVDLNPTIADHETRISRVDPGAAGANGQAIRISGGVPRFVDVLGGWPATLWGAVADGVTPSGAAINDALADEDDVFLPPDPTGANRDYLIEQTITVGNDKKLIGTVGNPAKMKAANGLNADVIRTVAWDKSTWWHGGEIAYVAINGNKANNTTGHAINAGRTGELSNIHHIAISNAAQSGIRLAGDVAPATITQVSGFDCGGALLFFDLLSGPVNIIQPSGDRNLGGMLHITSSIGAVNSINVIGMKSEIFGTGQAGHNPLVKLENFHGSINFIGGGWRHIDDSISPKTAIKITTTASPSFKWHDVRLIGVAGNYRMVIDDDTGWGSDYDLTATAAGTKVYNWPLVAAPDTHAVAVSGWNPGTIAAGGYAFTTVTMAGVTGNDYVAGVTSYPLEIEGVTWHGTVTGADTVRVTLINHRTTSWTPGAVSARVFVTKRP